MYMTSLAASQNSKLSIAEALAVGTESEAPALESVSTNGSNRPNSQTWHRLAVWTVGALVAGIRSKTRV